MTYAARMLTACMMMLFVGSVVRASLDTVETDKLVRQTPKEKVAGQPEIVHRTAYAARRTADMCANVCQGSLEMAIHATWRK